MKKYTIFKQGGSFYCTSYNNYHSCISNAYQKTEICCDNIETAKRIVVKYWKTKVEELEIIND